MVGPSNSETCDGLPVPATDRMALLAGAPVLWCSVTAVALLSMLLGVVALSGGLAGERSFLAPAARSGVSSSKGLTTLPLPAQGPVSAALGADDPAYRLSASDGGFAAVSPAQRLREHFGRTGVMLSSGDVRLGLSLRAVGYGTSLAAIGDVTPRVRTNRALYRRAGLSEWYVNGPLGVEQGFTLPRAPSGNPAEPLTLSMALSGNAHATLAPGGQSIALSHLGAPTLRYGALSATDASGRTLHSRLELHSGRVLIDVDTRGARYPLRIDPLIQQGSKLVAGESGEGHFGQSVALSADGNTALVGAPTGNNEAGAVWVFTRTGSTWTQQAELIAKGGEEKGNGEFGASVALSSDGSTALVGAPTNTGGGAVWAFKRSGSTWTQQGEKITGAEESANSEFGRSVALSAEGDTAVVGAPGDGGEAGAVWAFTLSEGTEGVWSQQGLKITPEIGEEVGNGQFGASVALSAVGNTMVVGAPTDNSNAGAVWVLTRSGSTWTQQGAKITPTASEESPAGEFGFSVALSSDGSTALIGAPANGEPQRGAAWAFTRSLEGMWTQQGGKLIGGGEEGEGRFGGSVALSSNGNTALIGASGDSSKLGAAWMFTRSEAGAWTPQGAKITPGVGEESLAGEFGFSVALSSDGNTALVGGPADSSGAGGAWAFVNPPTVSTVNPNKGPEVGGTSVTITGTNFNEATAVTFGSSNATSFAVISTTSITAVSPAGAGTVGVNVTTSGGTSPSGGGDQFNYLPLPSVTNISPNVGPEVGGTSVTITGTNLSEATVVKFGSSDATGVKVNSPTSITAVSPAGSGTVDVTVSTPGGTSATSSADEFSYVPRPTVVDVNPAAGPAAGGTSVTITGTNLNEATAVKFGSTSATGVKVVSATSIMAVAPAGTGTVDVTVSTPGGTSATSSADRFSYVPLPTVTSVSPNAGPTAGGTSVTITGTNLHEATQVKFGSADATGVKVNSATSITAVSPVGTGTVDVTVSTPGGTSATGASDEFNYVPPPTVSNVSPNVGPLGGGTSVTISGSGLGEATQVKFGSAGATGLKVNSATSITAVAPAGTGTVDVTVSTPGGTSATGSADEFSYVPRPTVAKVVPNKGPVTGGTSVTITGTNLSEATAVKFGSTNATGVKVNSETSITAVAPAGTGTVDVTVSTPGGTSATGSADEFSYVPPPAVTHVSPNKGPEAGGTSVTITGTNVGEATVVKFGASDATGVKVVSATSITAVAPAGTGTVDVTVSTVGGTSATGSSDKFSYVPLPAVTKVSPSKGPEAGGTSVTITGTNLSEATAVKFGSTNATGVKVNSETSITAVAPAGSGTVDVTVSTAGGTSVTGVGDEFRYVAPPTVASVSPDKGPLAGGTSVTITGTNFNEATVVKFGSSDAIGLEVRSATSITAVAPAGTGTVDVTVSTVGGTSATSAADKFSYVPSPTVSNINPNKGPEAGGASVTITGTNFNEATAVKFGSAGATGLKVNSATSITAVAPAGTGTVDVTVTTPGGTSATGSADRFSYVPPPAVTNVSPDAGPLAAGTSVTITGVNFNEATAVEFGSTNAVSFKVSSETSITAVAPAGTGEVDVTVSTPGGTSATGAADKFSYVATPTVTGVSPNAGPLAGGERVTITGTNFTSNTTVEFGGNSGTDVEVTTPTALTVVSAAGIGAVNVTVITPGGTSATSAVDEFSYPGPPTIEMGEPTAIGQTSAILQASLNPNGGVITQCYFHYERVVPIPQEIPVITPCVGLPISGKQSMPVSALAGAEEGLSAATSYRFSIEVINSFGETAFSPLPDSELPQFKTLPGPAVMTEAASLITQTSATLNATVNPNGGKVSDCHFEYGTTVAYGKSVPCSSLPGSGISPVAVSAPLVGLSENTPYFFRIVATNPGGTSKETLGHTFTTLPNPPVVATAAASSPTQTAATVNGTVNPSGGTVNDCRFEYGTSTSYGASVPCSSLPGSGNSPVAVSAGLGSLNANTAYHFRIVATNLGGTGHGGDQAFTTAPIAPTTTTTAAPTPTPTPTTTPLTAFKTLTATCRVSLASTSAMTQSAGVAAIKLIWTGAGTSTCAGKLTLTVMTKGGSRQPKAKLVGTGAFSLALGKVGIVRVRLNEAGRALLNAGHGRLSARLAILELFPGPSQAQTETVHLAREARSSNKHKK